MPRFPDTLSSLQIRVLAEVGCGETSVHAISYQLDEKPVAVTNALRGLIQRGKVSSTFYSDVSVRTYTAKQ
jgi:DNA-binding MarR family transcriptional regulator